MPPSRKPTETAERFIEYLRFISDMLGGDVLSLDTQANELRQLISHRTIDYELMRDIVLEIQKHNAIFHQNEYIEAFPTLDALGIIRGELMHHKGDVNQISLLDHMGELTVSFFNLQAPTQVSDNRRVRAQIYPLKPAIR